MAESRQQAPEHSSPKGDNATTEDKEAAKRRAANGKRIRQESHRAGKRQARIGKVTGKAAKTTGKALVSGDRSIQALKAEWLAGLVLIFGYPLVKRGAFDDFNFWVSRMLAWSVVYLVLMLVASAGPQAARLARAFGGLVLLALMFAPFNGGRYGAVILGDSVGRLNNKPNENAVGNLNTPAWLNQLLSAPPPAPPPGAPPLPLVKQRPTNTAPAPPQQPPMQSV